MSGPEPPAEGVRRRALLRAAVTGGAGVAGVLAGVGGTLAAQGAQSPPPPAPLPATENLMAEHGLLNRILLIYRAAATRLTTADTLRPDPLFRSAQIVHDYIESFHEGIEEGYVFPALWRAGKLTGTVRTLLVQHDRGRRLTMSIINAATPMAMDGMPAAPGFATAERRTALAAQLTAFVTMYEPHEAWEDTVILPAFREIVTGRDFDRISEQVAEAQQHDYGADGYTDLVDQVADIERELGIGDLDRYTPPEQT